MSDDGYRESREHPLLEAGEDAAPVESWQTMRTRINTSNRGSEAGSSDQENDPWASKRSDSMYSHPAGRWESEGEFLKYTLIPCECYQRMPRWKKCCCISSMFIALVIVVMIPITFLVIIPNIIDDAVNHSTTVLIRAEISDPDSVKSTVRMATHLQLNNAGGNSATIEAFRVSIYANDNVYFGEVDMPEIEVKADAPTEIYINDTMTVTNAEEFVKATAKVLQGPCDPDLGKASACTWHATGKPTVKLKLMGITLSYSTNFNGDIPLPLTQLAVAQASNIQLTGGDETRLHAVADTTFFSQSLLELKRLGHMVFQLTDLDGEVIGNASMANFEVRRGTNFISPCKTTVYKTDTNEKALRKFMSGVSQGKDQHLMIQGPIDGCPLFMQHITKQAFIVKGVSDLRANPIRQSLINNKAAEGHVPTGGKCSLLTSQDCVRGSVNVLHSPMNLVSMSFVDLDLYAWLYEPIEYSFQHPLLSPTPIHCPSTNKLVNQFTRMGMYPDDPHRKDILMPPNKSISVLVPAGPILPDEGKKCAIAGAIGSPYSCCFTSRQLAASCRAKSRGEWSFDTSLNGSVTIQVGNFSLNVDIDQPLLTVFYEDAFTTGFENGLLSCDNVKF